MKERSQPQFSPLFVSRGTGKREEFEGRAKVNVDTIGPDDIKGKGGYERNRGKSSISALQ